MSNADINDLFSRLADQAAKPAQFDMSQVTSTPIEGRGSAADDRIRVRIVNGKVTEFDVQHPALRLDRTVLCAELAKAVNGALETYQTNMVSAVQNRTDFGALSEDLRDMQAESIQTINAYTDRMMEMLLEARKRDE
ncbi:MAG: hypothetical protein L0G99_12135 [Propionibacteriales bacterium]|nr:hypothetical protein [Propionibacteriales bacterium]